MSLFECISTLTVNFLVPLGGLAVVLLVGWRCDFFQIIGIIKSINERFLMVSLMRFLKIIIKYFAPVMIGVILLNFILSR